MRFILRCIFWLCVVYSSILADVGGRTAASGRDDIVQTTRAAIASPVNAVASRAATALSTYCRHDAGTCLADSARLTALVAASADDVSETDAATPATRRPDPRHRARGAMQARMP